MALALGKGWIGEGKIAGERCSGPGDQVVAVESGLAGYEGHGMREEEGWTFLAWTALIG